MIDAKPKFLNGIYPFEGVGYDKVGPLSDKLVYSVPIRQARPVDLFPRRQFQRRNDLPRPDAVRPANAIFSDSRKRHRARPACRG